MKVKWSLLTDQLIKKKKKKFNSFSASHVDKQSNTLIWILWLSTFIIYFLIFLFITVLFECPLTIKSRNLEWRSHFDETWIWGSSYMDMVLINLAIETDFWTGTNYIVYSLLQLFKLFCLTAQLETVWMLK